MRDWEERLSPPLPDVEGQGPQDGPQEANSESPGSPRVFHFHFFLLSIGHCLQVFAQIQRKAPLGVEDTTTGTPTRWDEVDPGTTTCWSPPHQDPTQDPHTDCGWVQPPAIGTPGDTTVHCTLSGYRLPTLDTPPATLL